MNADFFRPLGIFVRENFFDDPLCAALLKEAKAAPRDSATVGEGDTLVVDVKTRSTKQLVISRESLQLVEEKLLAIKQDLEEHFGVPLTGCQKPQFLGYVPGDFYRRHRDISVDEGAPAPMKKRKVSVIIFLNPEGNEEVEDSYNGGSLTFYGLLSDPRLKNRGFPLNGRPGMLVAFGADVIHEVQAVTRGERYSVVTWFD